MSVGANSRHARYLPVFAIFLPRVHIDLAPDGVISDSHGPSRPVPAVSVAAAYVRLIADMVIVAILLKIWCDGVRTRIGSLRIDIQICGSANNSIPGS
jgi:hypothetical protein